MMPSPSLLRLTPVVLAALCAMACASAAPSASEEPAEGEVGASEDEVRASCTNPRKYFATFHDGAATCRPVAGRGGRWLPEPLFAGAPAEIQTTTCAYRWSGAKSSRPDRESLVDEVGFENGLAAACGNSSDVSSGNVHAIPQIDFVGQAGSVGCDVCGIVKDRNIFVVLPPEKILLKQFSVRLSNGKARSFQIEATEARALSVTLPPPPRGTKYLPGHVQIL